MNSTTTLAVFEAIASTIATMDPKAGAALAERLQAALGKAEQSNWHVDTQCVRQIIAAAEG
jgi:hypothetical protein